MLLKVPCEMGTNRFRRNLRQQSSTVGKTLQSVSISDALTLLTGATYGNQLALVSGVWMLITRMFSQGSRDARTRLAAEGLGAERREGLEKRGDVHDHVQHAPRVLADHGSCRLGSDESSRRTGVNRNFAARLSLPRQVREE